MMDVAPHIWSNVVVLLLLLGLLGVVRVVRRNRLWSEAAVELWRRRRLAILVVAFYVLIGLLDSVAWKGGVPEGTPGVLPNAPLSLLDWSVPAPARPAP